MVTGLTLFLTHALLSFWNYQSMVQDCRKAAQNLPLLQKTPVLSSGKQTVCKGKWNFKIFKAWGQEIDSVDSDQAEVATFFLVNIWIPAGPLFSPTQVAFGSSQDHRHFFQFAFLCFLETRYRENLVGVWLTCILLLEWEWAGCRSYWKLVQYWSTPWVLLDLEVKT